MVGYVFDIKIDMHMIATRISLNLGFPDKAFVHLSSPMRLAPWPKPRHRITDQRERTRARNMFGIDRA